MAKRNLKEANERSSTNSGFHERTNERSTTLCASLDTCTVETNPLMMEILQAESKKEPTPSPQTHTHSLQRFGRLVSGQIDVLHSMNMYHTRTALAVQGDHHPGHLRCQSGRLPKRQADHPWPGLRSTQGQMAQGQMRSMTSFCSRTPAC